MSESRSLTVAERLSAIPAFAMPQEEALSTLCASVYPGAKPASALMVLAYCKANLLDPFQKPVHIVQMEVKKADGEKEERDVVMPGVGLYRTQAARTGQYAGMSEPEFGPMKVLRYKAIRWVDNGKKKSNGSPYYDKEEYDAELEYPEWCRITVKRLVGGHVAEFPAVEYWIENYATIGNTTAPNSMWRKRPRGQLAKCAEAQALRKAFPEVGAAPTAEEMEGKSLDASDLPPPINPEPPVDRPRPQSKSEQAKADAVDVDPATGEVANGNGGDDNLDAGPPASASMVKIIRAKAEAKGITEEALCKEYGIAKLSGISLRRAKPMLEALQR